MYYLTGLVGIIAIVAPFLFGYSGDITALWTSIIVGIVLLGSSIFEAFAEDRERWEYWVVGLVGLAAIVAPFALGFSALEAALWTMVAVGATAVIAAGTKLFSGTTKLRF